LPIEFDQLGEGGSKEKGDPVKAFNETPRIDLQLFTDASQRNSVQIIHSRRIGHQLIAIEVFREHTGNTRLEDSPTLGAIAFGEPIDQWFSPKRATLHYESLGVAFIHERRTALRTEVPYGRNHGVKWFSLNEIGTWTSSSKVPRTRPSGVASLFLWPIGFEGDPGRGRGGTEKPFLSFSLLIAKFLFQTLILFLEGIDFSLFLETLRTTIDHSLSSRSPITCL